MGRVRIELHRLATKELRGALRWYARRSLRAAVGLEQAVAQALDAIAANPKIGVPLEAPYRAIRLRGYRYLPIYELIGEDRLHVVAAAHGSRRPGYWRRRKRL